MLKRISILKISNTEKVHIFDALIAKKFMWDRHLSFLWIQHYKKCWFWNKQDKALVSVGAVGAAAPIDFQKDWFCTDRFWETMIFIPKIFTFFYSKVTFIFSFSEHIRKSAPTVLKSYPGPCRNCTIWKIVLTFFKIHTYLSNLKNIKGWNSPQHTVHFHLSPLLFEWGTIILRHMLFEENWLRNFYNEGGKLACIAQPFYLKFFSLFCKKKTDHSFQLSWIDLKFHLPFIFLWTTKLN